MSLRELLCAVFGHRSLPGTTPARCLVYHCPRCRCLVRGGASALTR